MDLNPYLNFNGNCKEAFTFYAKLLGADAPMLMHYADMPKDQATGGEGCADMPFDMNAMADKVMHGQLEGKGFRLMGCDVPFGFEGQKGVNVALQVDSIADAHRIYDALTDGGTVVMPIAETFWAERFGMLTDRFGVNWMINCMKTEYATQAAE